MTPAAETVASLQNSINGLQTKIVNIKNKQINGGYASQTNYFNDLVSHLEVLMLDYQQLVGLLQSSTIQLTAAQMSATPSTPTGGTGISETMLPSSTPMNTSSPLSVATAVGMIKVYVSDFNRSQTFTFNFDSTVIQKLNAQNQNIWSQGIYIKSSLTQNASAWSLTVSLTDTNNNILATGSMPTTIALDVLSVAINTAEITTANPTNNTTALLNVPLGQTILYKSTNSTSPVKTQPFVLKNNHMSVKKGPEAAANTTSTASTPTNTNMPASVASGLTSIVIQATTQLTNTTRTWLSFTFDSTIINAIKKYYPQAFAGQLTIALNVIKSSNNQYLAVASIMDSQNNVLAYGEQVTPANLQYMNVTFNNTEPKLADGSTSTALYHVKISNTVVYQQSTTTSPILIMNLPAAAPTTLPSASKLYYFNIVVQNQTQTDTISLTSEISTLQTLFANHKPAYLNCVVQNNNMLYFNFIGLKNNQEKILLTGNKQLTIQNAQNWNISTAMLGVDGMMSTPSIALSNSLPIHSQP